MMEIPDSEAFSVPSPGTRAAAATFARFYSRSVSETVPRRPHGPQAGDDGSKQASRDAGQGSGTDWTTPRLQEDPCRTNAERGDDRPQATGEPDGVHDELR